MTEHISELNESTYSAEENIDLLDVKVFQSLSSGSFVVRVKGLSWGETD